MLSLDIRTLSFLATLTSLLLAVGLQLVNRVITQEPALRLWARGAMAASGGFILLALRGMIPDVLSIVVANTLIVMGAGWQYAGNLAFQGEKPRLPWYWWLTAITAVLFVHFTYLMPNLIARIVVISAVFAVLRFACSWALLYPLKDRNRLVRWCIAAAFLIVATFMGVRAVYHLFTGPTDQNFMAASGAMQTFSFVFMIGLDMVLGIGLPLLVLGRTQHQLIASENRYRSLIEDSPAPMGVIGDGKLHYANPAAVRMFGARSLHALQNRPMLELIHPDSRQLALDRIETALKTGMANPLAEEQYLRFDGSSIDVEVQSTPILYDGQPALQVTLNDISERKRAETALREKAQELQRSNSELEQFSYAVSHDLRQPLRMISSYLQLLKRSLGDSLGAENREFFNFAIDGAKRMDAMMLGLLEYSRVGRKGETAVWMDSRAVLDDALLFLQPLVIETQANLHIEGQWPRICAGPDAVLRLLQNLIGNALKFRVAQRMPEVTVHSEKTDTQWRLCISDNGIGIQPEQISRLFQVFARLQLRTAYEGSGIGLALCRKIVEHHGGDIWAESPGEDQGSQFYVVLPLRQKDVEVPS